MKMNATEYALFLLCNFKVFSLYHELFNVVFCSWFKSKLGDSQFDNLRGRLEPVQTLNGGRLYRLTSHIIWIQWSLSYRNWLRWSAIVHFFSLFLTSSSWQVLRQCLLILVILIRSPFRLTSLFIFFIFLWRLCILCSQLLSYPLFFFVNLVPDSFSIYNLPFISSHLCGTDSLPDQASQWSWWWLLQIYTNFSILAYLYHCHICCSCC